MVQTRRRPAAPPHSSAALTSAVPTPLLRNSWWTKIASSAEPVLSPARHGLADDAGPLCLCAYRDNLQPFSVDFGEPALCQIVGRPQGLHFLLEALSSRPV